MLSEKTYPATTGGLVSCQEFLSSLCESPRPQIIMDEIVSNIVRCSGAPDFTVRIDSKEPDGIVAMTFIDAGKPFDPTREIATPDITARPENREIGGLGMFMVKKLSRSVTYRRVDGRNELSVAI